MTQDTAVHVRHATHEGGRIAYLTIDNAAKRNALTPDLMGRFIAACAGLAGDADLRAVVVTGAGDRAFVGGADIETMAGLAGPEAARGFIGRVHACCAAVRDLPAPVIARINGYALGAGLELAVACDLRVASETAMFGMPEVRLGVPSVVEAALLPALVGWGRTREMLLLGEMFDAATALRIGLIEAVVAPEALDAEVERRVAAILAGGPRAVRLQKALIRAWEDLPLRAAIAAGVDSFAAAFEGPEPTDLMAAHRAARAARSRSA